MPTALMRAVSPAIHNCELTHLDRTPIDVERAQTQHGQYATALRELGWTVVELPALADRPDGVFVEDTVVVLDELVILSRPGADARRPEVDSMEAALRSLSIDRPIERITPPGTLDGGDVLTIGKRIWVGRTARTNEYAIRQIRDMTSPHGYEVREVPCAHCLHLKTGVCWAGDDVVLINPSWIDATHFDGFRVVDIDPTEPFSANVLALDGVTLAPEAHRGVLARLEKCGIVTRTVAADELAKAEGGLTCCSVLVRSM